MEVNKIYNVDVLEGLKQLEDKSINLVVTSPPYWCLRDYYVDGQIGNEEHPQDYINKIVNIFSEIKRILKDDGSIYLNVGDSFYTKSGSGQGINFYNTHQKLDKGKGNLKKMHTEIRGKFKTNWLQSKQLLLIPSRIAISMQDNGWILRNDIIWAKRVYVKKEKKIIGTSIPTSVQDRVNCVYEHLFHFVKSQKYKFNLDPIRLPVLKQSIERAGRARTPKPHHSFKSVNMEYKRGQNLVDVWQINPARNSRGHKQEENHIAMYPKELIEDVIKMGSLEGDVILDPFIGSGTTAIVCKQLNRNFIGFDISKEYVEMANKRLAQKTLSEVKC